MSLNGSFMNPDRLQIWGGVECTINRIGNRFFNQLARRTISERLEDLERIAGLGIRTLRFPILWEEVMPVAGAPCNWSWADAGLDRLQRLKIRPIVGLVHHGSGPSYTGLLDPGFAQKLADYARQVAERFPWLEAYTPVNEPLTTARFSALYGHWYPHRKSSSGFCTALLNQLRGTVLAMKAIKGVNPQAQLIQTEDLGKVFSSPKLDYQAEMENERRWLVFDLLTGRFECSGTIWSYFRQSGVKEGDLEEILANPCTPALLGLNHYVTSARYLDDDLAAYPFHFRGGNGRHEYVDIEAVRSKDCQFCEPVELFREAWNRYHIPIAITEAHLGCTREEQMRWFAELWKASLTLRGEGVPVVAVTAWSLFGAFDWNSLLVRQEGHYESGIFDLRSPEPRETALAGLIRQVAASGKCEHALIEIPGWWRREIRLPSRDGRHPPECSFLPCSKTSPLLITGATGTLGQAFARICHLRGIPYRLLSRAEMDIANEDSVREVLGRYRPWGVVNAAGYVRVDAAENDSARCRRENARGPGMLASACAQTKVRLLAFSSDLVFDGLKKGAYLESDAVFPLNVYGLSKAEAELDIARADPDALIVRTSSFFGPWDTHNFLVYIIRALTKGLPVSAAEDARISPTYVPEMVNCALDLLIDGERGIWHLANDGSTTWADFAAAAAGHAKLDSGLIQRCSTRELNLPAKRPLNSALSSERGLLLGAWEEALERFFFEMVALPE